MKELSIEEKAKHYDEVREKISIRFGSNVADEIFSLFEMSEDEGIELLNYLYDVHDDDEERARWIAWLEKQGEQDMIPLDKAIKFLDEQLVNDKDEVTGEPFINFQNYGAFKETFISYFKRKMLEKQGQQKLTPIFRIGDTIIAKDETYIEKEPFHIDRIEDDCYWDGENTILVCNQDEFEIFKQNPADKVEPKFKVGDIIKPKDRGHEPWQIMQVDILDKKYRFKDGYVIHFSQEDNYELIEQKPAWSEEVQEEHVSEEFINALGTMLNDGLPDRYLVSEERIKKSAGLLFSIVRKQLKNEMQEWSEEDEYTLNETIQHLKQLIEIDKAKHCACDVQYYQRDIDWLKSLKERVQPQPKQEWSGVDEAHLHSLITHLEQWIERHPNTTGADIQGENVAWLKSLRPQNTWKPSDAQMASITCAVRKMKESACYDSELVSLYNDLKKLNE